MFGSWGRRQLRPACVLVLIAHATGLIPVAWAGPGGGVVARGSASIDQSITGQTLITQSTDRAVINWQSFSTSAGEAVRFAQPTASAVTLNRVTSAAPSVLDGSLSANGRVFVLNPNGVLFGANARVDTAGLVASTLHMADDDFMAGRYHLSQPAGAKLAAVVNKGTIVAKDSGSVALVAPVVDNQGTIQAPGGRVALAAGTKALVSLDDGQLVTLAVSSGPPRDVNAPDGWVSDAVSTVVNNRHLVDAGTVTVKDGEVTLGHAEGVAVHQGAIDVSGKPGVNAGTARVESTRVTGLAAGSAVRANGSGERSSGGDVRALAAGTAIFAKGARMEARGGDTGDGGFVELSGKAHVLVAGSVSTSAAGGRAGLFLIDPSNLRIVDATPADLDADLVAGGGTLGLGVTGDNSPATGLDTVSVAQINALSADSNIELNATGTVEFANTQNIMLEDGPPSGAGGTGASFTIQTDATTGSGDIFSSVPDPGDIVAGEGALGTISLVAGGSGTINLTNLSINAQSGDVNIEAGGNVTLGPVTFGSLAKVHSKAGSILDGTGGAVTLTGGQADLFAADSIASTGARLKLEVNTINAIAGNGMLGTGDIGLMDDSGFTIGTLTAGNAIDLRASGTVTLGSTGAGIVSANTVTIVLLAGDVVDGQADGGNPLTNVAAFTSAFIQASGGGGLGDFEVSTPGYTALGDPGNASLNTPNTELGSVAANFGIVSIQGRGNLLDDNGASPNVTAPGGLALKYPNHIGFDGVTPDPLELSAGGLLSARAASGEIRLDNSTGIQQLDLRVDQGNRPVDVQLAGADYLTNGAGGLNASVTGADVTFVAGAGNIQLGDVRLNGAGDDLIVNAQAGSIQDDGNDLTYVQANVLNLTASGDIGNLGPSADIDTAVKVIHATAGDATPGGSGEISIADRDAGNDPLLGQINADGGFRNLRVTGARSLLDDGNDGTLLIGDVVEVLAEENVGTAGGPGPAIDTAANTLKVSAGTNGDGGIWVKEASAVAIDVLDAFADGSGTMGDVVLTAGGAITDLDGSNLLDVRGATVTLSAATAVGGPGTPAQIETDTNLLNVDSGTSGDGGIGIFEVPGSSPNGLALGTINAFTDGVGSKGNVDISSSGGMFDGNGAAANVVGASTTTLIADLEVGQAGTDNEIDVDTVSLAVTSGAAAGGDIWVTSTASVALGLIDADGGAANVNLVALGAITDGNGATAANVRANVATLTANTNVGGPGTAAAIDTDVNVLNATSGTNGFDGGVYVNEVGGVTTGDLTTGLLDAYGDSGGTVGNVEVTVAGNLIDGNDGTPGTPNVIGTLVMLSAAGDVGGTGVGPSIDTLAETLSGTAANYYVKEVGGAVAIGTINAGGGTVQIIGDTVGGIVDGADDTAIDITAGSVLLDALGQQIGTLNPNGGIDVAPGTLVSASGGDVAIQSVGGGFVVGAIGGAGTVRLEADGSISDEAPDDAGDIGGTSLVIALTAAGNIGGGANGSLDTDVTTVRVDAQPGSNVNLHEIIGAIAIDQINAPGGAVTIATDGGAVNDDVNDGNADVTAASLTINAGAGTVGAGAGGSLDTQVGLLSITASGADVDQVAGNLPIGLIDVGGGTLTLSAAGSVTDETPDTVADIVASSANLTAGGGIGTGANGPLDIDLTLLSASGTDVIVQEVNGGLMIGSITATVGQVSISAAGAITDDASDPLADVTAPVGVTLNAASVGGGANGTLDLDVAKIDITAPSVSVEVLSSAMIGVISSAGGAVAISGAGSIVDDLNDAAADIIANAASIQVGGFSIGGGVNGSLDTDVNELSAAGGAIDVAETSGSIAIGLVDAAGGPVSLSAPGNIVDEVNDGAPDFVASSLVLSGAAIGGGANGSLDTNVGVLRATGTSLVIDQPTTGMAIDVVNVGPGSVTLSVAGSITDDTADALPDIVAGSAQLTAMGGDVGGGANGPLDTNVVTLGASGNNIAVQETSGVALATLSAPGGIVTLVSAGAITDDVNDALPDVVAADATLTAAGAAIGGGVNGSLDTDVSTLSVTGSNADLAEASGLLVGTIDVGGGTLNLAVGGTLDDEVNDGAPDLVAGDATISAALAIGSLNGSLDLGVSSLVSLGASAADLSQAAGDLNVGSVNVASGALALSAPGGIVDANGGAVNLTAGAATLVAGTGIGAADALETSIDTLDAVSTSGGIRIQESGGLTLVRVVTGAPFTGGDGVIDVVVSAGDLVMGDGTGQAVIAEADLVHVNAGAGSILDGNGGALNVLAGVLDAGAGTGIGAADPLETQVAALIAGANGGISLTNGGPIVLELVNGGSLTLDAAGSMIVKDVRAPNGAVVLSTSMGGSILDGTPAVVDLVAGSLTLTSSGDIGTRTAPLLTEAGSLSFSAGSGNAFLTQNGGATLDGTVVAGDFAFFGDREPHAR